MANATNLPTDIKFLVLDNLLKGEPRLTHEAVCSIRNLSLTDITWNGTVNHCMQRESTRSYLRASLSYHADRAAAQKVIGLGSSAPITGPPDQGLDALSSAVRDDCPGCFQWTCQLLGGPGLHGCNSHGWTYLSLAIDACAVKTLRYFCSTGPAPVLPIDCICQNGSVALPPDIPLQRAVNRENLDIIDLLLTDLEAHPVSPAPFANVTRALGRPELKTGFAGTSAVGADDKPASGSDQMQIRSFLLPQSPAPVLNRSFRMPPRSVSRSSSLLQVLRPQTRDRLDLRDELRATPGNRWR